ncbi:MAG: hypothetical protein J6Y08_07250 [Clostridiales bacterium]|nr:hypothetical protein [Clostridiales bacterium]
MADDNIFVEKTERAQKIADKQKKKQERKDIQKRGAQNVCRFGIVQGILSFLALIVFLVAWFCIHKMTPLPRWYRVIVMIVLQMWVRAEKYISLLVWLYCRRLKKKYDAKGETLSNAKPAIVINRAYTIAAALPTLIVQIALLIIKLM